MSGNHHAGNSVAESIPCRFEAVKDVKSSWSVVDHLTHLSVSVMGVSMDGLSEALARRLTDVLNDAPALISAPTKH